MLLFPTFITLLNLQSFSLFSYFLFLFFSFFLSFFILFLDETNAFSFFSCFLSFLFLSFLSSFLFSSFFHSFSRRNQLGEVIASISDFYNPPQLAIVFSFEDPIITLRNMKREESRNKKGFVHNVKKARSTYKVVANTKGKEKE